MKIAVKQYGRTVVVAVPQDDLSIEEVFAVLVTPVLLALGYGESSIDKVVDGVVEDRGWTTWMARKSFKCT